ncbi:wax ester synthase-like acyl-CoA acyltransferase family protein [Streptomyces sp. BK208]|uniref:wax ester/triacylglycerol synthase domain-containing protein n=1 Tax=Streptomyces sp. BK208 TaxID=2512150 RepID=UPI0010D62092|nr:wax ester/triacylglycerol synthase domain-containing protein [Streptomyces sp. BK208]TDT40135.1 wax ester synthase-like acyl-CoA acyltransferase family protein [Streptomyces sp. BK208]
MSLLLGAVDRSFTYEGSEPQPVTGFFLALEGKPPSREYLVARVSERVGSLPALWQPQPQRGRRLRPTAAVRLDPVEHVRWAVDQDLTAFPAALLAVPLRAGVPAWDLWCAPGRDDGRFQVAFRIHHAVHDGMGAAHDLLTLLCDDSPPPLRPVERKRPTATGCANVVKDLTRSLGGRRRHRSIPLPRPGDPVRWAWEEVPERIVHEIARRSRCTGNDICLAAFAWALRLNASQTTAGNQARAPDFDAVIPMSTRDDRNRTAPGNQLVAFRLRLPVSAGSFEEAVDRVVEQSRAARVHRRRDAARWLLELSPTAVGAWASRVMMDPRTAPVIASSLTFPAVGPCLGARLLGTSMMYNLAGGTRSYLSFTRAQGVMRCGLAYRASWQADSVPALWRHILVRLARPKTSPGANNLLPER